MEHYLGTLKHPRNTKFITLEPQLWAIHVRFNDTKSNIEMSKLDKSFAGIILDRGIGPLTKKSSEIDASKQVTKQP